MSTSDANIILTPATFARMMNAVKVVESLRGAGVNAIPGMGATFNRRQPTPRNVSPPYRRRPVYPVITNQSGGSNGNKTTQASYTYDFYDIADTGKTNKLNAGSAQSPSVARKNGTVTKAVLGLAYDDRTNGPTLLYVFEIQGTGGC